MLFALFGKNISVQNTYKNKADTTNSNYLDQLENCREKTSCNTKVCSFLSLLCPSAGATLCVVKMSPSPTFHSGWRESRILPLRTDRGMCCKCTQGLRTIVAEVGWGTGTDDAADPHNG